MKKLIAILAIAIVLIGAVFATETHSIKIKADVTEVLPVFQMTIGQITTNTANNGAKFDNATTYALGTVDDPETQANEEANIGDSFSFETAHTVTVSVKINNAAKTNHIYTLTFINGTFTVKKAGVSTTINPTITAGVGSNSGAGNGFVTTVDDAVATVSFNGTTCTATHEVATASYAYAADTLVDPGVYYADVVLQITSN